MESQVAKQRMSTIAAHFAAAPDNISGAAAHIFPMNCSISLNSAIRRCDNRMQFARQGSSSQAFFMRQASKEQVSSPQSGVPLNSTGFANDGLSNAFDAPLFSRPASMKPNFPNVSASQVVVHECNLSTAEPPEFARPNIGIIGQQHLRSRKKAHSSRTSGFEWSPNMDVEESGCHYVIMVELPGVSINDIRVEVNDHIHTLTVMGKNWSKRWRPASSNDRVSTSHQRDISQGKFQVVWPLPHNVNKDGISAEFVDGLLRITIPKL